MEDGPGVGEPLWVAASCDLQEVPSGARHDLVKQLHGDPSVALSPLTILHLNVEEDSEGKKNIKLLLTS